MLLATRYGEHMGPCLLVHGISMTASITTGASWHGISDKEFLAKKESMVRAHRSVFPKTWPNTLTILPSIHSEIGVRGLSIVKGTNSERPQPHNSAYPDAKPRALADT